MPMTVDDIRAEILIRLRVNSGPDSDWHADRFEDLAPAKWLNGNTTRPAAVDVFAALWQLAQQGIIIPGHRSHGRFDQNADAFKSFPFFSITSYGRKMLAALADDLHPADAADYLEKLKSRVPSASDTVLLYVGEAVATFNSQHYLSSVVNLGVATETLLEQLYDVLGAHLGGNSNAYRLKLDGKRWAGARLEYVRTRLKDHLDEFPSEFATRVEQYLDMLAQIIKLSRDDAGHARPLRIDREIASMNLVSFPVLAGIIHELMTRLRETCTKAP
jgi:hypothetical protein